MARSVRIKAAAKVNLHLRVYNRRPDGFHGILSVFQAISLSDSIVIRSLKEPDTLEIEGDFDCPARATTIYKAAIAYRGATGIGTGLSVCVDKRIPAGAGLGGGSSDAAAILAGLEALLGGGLDASSLAELGASIGSDVPFFLSSGAAIVKGRGEIVEPMEARSDFSLVIAFPGFPVSTAWAYALLDKERPDGSGESDPDAKELASAYLDGIGQWPFSNSFEPVIGASKPAILEAKRILLDAGASFAAMSGSGSSVFGIFEEGAATESAVEGLKASGCEAWLAVPLARSAALD